MNNIKFVIIILFVYLALSFQGYLCSASNNNLTIYQFGDSACYHCENEKKFLTKMEEKYNRLNVKYLNAYGGDSELLKIVAQELGISVGGVPFLVIADDYIFGYRDEISTGLEIENKILNCLNNNCRDLVFEKINILSNNEIVEKKLENIKNQEDNSSIIVNKRMFLQLKGRIILKVQEKGEAYYINPVTEKMHFLGRAKDAFYVMRQAGVGISINDLEKFPIALVNFEGKDTDGDGLSDVFEEAVGTKINKIDSNDNGINDKDEILFEKIYDHDFIKKNLGKIFISVERNGEAWYINPEDGKRYFLGKPDDAFMLMRKLGLGISTNDFNNLNNNF